MTIEQKKQALNNGLKNLGFNTKYFINSVNGGVNAKFAICYKNEVGGYVNVTSYLKYMELNIYMMAYVDGLNNKLN